MRFPRILLLPALTAVAACAGHPMPRPIASIAPTPPAAAPVAFAGYGTLAVPPRLADGRYATPNSDVSAAATIWHLRAGLNVAALSCRGPQEAALVAGYNALLRRYGVAFDQAYRTLGGEYGGVVAFDGAMTRLYNYYALPPAQAGLCAAAQRVLAGAALLPADGLAGFAPAALATLEQPYRDVFARQEAWLATRPAITAVAPPVSTPRVRIEAAVLRRP